MIFFKVTVTVTMIFLMILIIKSCKHLSNKDPFIAFNFDVHLFCKMKFSALQAV